MDVDNIGQTLQASKTLDNVSAHSLILEDEFCSRIATAVSNKFGKMLSAFVNFRNNLKVC